MAGNGGRVAGIVSIVISVMVAVAGIVNLTSGHHPVRARVFLIAFGVLLILGIVLVAVSGRKSTKAPVQ